MPCIPAESRGPAPAMKRRDKRVPVAETPRRKRAFSLPVPFIRQRATAIHNAVCTKLSTTPVGIVYNVQQTGVFKGDPTILKRGYLFHDDLWTMGTNSRPCPGKPESCGENRLCKLWTTLWMTRNGERTGTVRRWTKNGGSSVRQFRPFDICEIQLVFCPFQFRLHVLQLFVVQIDVGLGHVGFQPLRFLLQFRDPRFQPLQ